MASQKIALVTGANKGIGFAIVRALCKEFSDRGIVYLASRNKERGEEAIKKLEAEGLSPKWIKLDILNNDDIEAVAKYLKDSHGGLDILVNNAGIAFKAAATEPNSVQAPVTIETNTFATLRVCRALVPLVRSHGRVVNVASRSGSTAYSKLSPELKARFKKVDTDQGVTDLMNEFISAAKEEKQTEGGWPKSNYGVSKLGQIALTRIHANEVLKDSSKEDVLINACCPGYVATDMSSHKGHLTIDQGAVTPVYLALLPPGSDIQGKFVAEKNVMDFW